MLTTAVITQVLSHYDLGILHSATAALRGFVNETGFAQTSEGQFVVRRNNRRNSEAVLRYRHQLISYLSANDFPTAALVPARTGDTLLALGGRFYEVMQFVRGESVQTGHPEHLFSVGETLARYHMLMHRCPPPPDAPQMRYSPHCLLGMTEELLKHDDMGDLTDVVTWYDARTAYLRKMLPDEMYAHLPHVVIHGDMHRDNVLFAQDRVVALLDYDQVGWDTPLADLCDALIAFASNRKPGAVNWGIFPGPLDEACADVLLEGYTSVLPLSSTELAVLPILLEVLWLQGELGRVLSTPEGAPDYHRSVLHQGCQLSQWLNEHREYVTAHWAQIVQRASRHCRAVAA